MPVWERQTRRASQGVLLLTNVFFERETKREIFLRAGMRIFFGGWPEKVANRIRWAPWMPGAPGANFHHWKILLVCVCDLQWPGCSVAAVRRGGTWRVTGGSGHVAGRLRHRKPCRLP